MSKALDRLPEFTEKATDSIHFAFCVLEQPKLVEFDLDFSKDWRDHGQLEQRFQDALKKPLRPDWAPEVPLKKRAVKANIKSPRSYGGSQRKLLVYMPSIEPKSFIHLSIRGESYALRSFGGMRPDSRWMDPGCKTTTELLASHTIKHQVDVAAERKNLQSETRYWTARISEVTRQFGIGGA